MNPLLDFVKKSKRYIWENVYARKIDIKLDRAIFSFTFDDAPISAATTGAEILERYHATGTYYLAMGMPESDANKRFFVGAQEIAPLLEKGHQIGCHTYGHIDLSKEPTAKACADCDRNTGILKELLAGRDVEHFAYPLGRVSLANKKQLRHRYITLRSTYEGINQGRTDLTYLKSIPVYSSTLNRTHILDMIKKAVRDRGWLIFYTHDIADKPTPWGATAEDFQWAVEQCANTGGEILNIGQAFSRITDYHPNTNQAV